MLLLALGVDAPATAQDFPYFPLDLARPLPEPQESLLMLEPARGALPPFALRFSLHLMGGHAPLRYEEADQARLQIDDVFTAAVGAAIGLGVADLGVSVPVLVAVSGEWDGQHWEATSFGDVVLVPRAAAPLGRLGLPLDLVLSVPVALPTGNHQAFAGRGAFTAEPRLRVAVHAGRFRVAARPGVLIQGGGELAQPHLCNWLTLRVGAGVELGRERRFRPELGLDALLPTADPSTTSAELLAGLSVHPGWNLTLSAHGGIGLGSLPGVAAGRLVIGVSWEGGGPRPTNELDGDGLKGRWDLCPEDPEDVDGFQDRDGCPDPDNDGDGTPDPSDACPDTAGRGPDGCPHAGGSVDLDGDGLRERDVCPLEPEDPDGFEDHDGCPDPDNDGDRFPDEVDSCPDEPEDGRPPAPRDGCPVRG